jgi:hypothetical protein
MTRGEHRSPPRAFARKQISMPRGEHVFQRVPGSLRVAMLDPLGLAAHLVRDEGVAGSNPAAPTNFLNTMITKGPDMGNETPCRRSSHSVRTRLCGRSPSPPCSQVFQRVKSQSASPRPYLRRASAQLHFSASHCTAARPDAQSILG